MTIDAPPRPRERPPAEHRFLGLDRRSLVPALVVTAVFLLATVVVPRIDDAISWDDPVRAGDRMVLSGDLQLTPAAGWNVEKGQRAGAGGSPIGSPEAQLVHDGVTFDVNADSFDGQPRALLRQVAKVTSSTTDPSFAVAGRPTSVTTIDGHTGVVQAYSSAQGDGLVAAFVIDGTGVEITAYGPPTQMTAAAEEIAAMVHSLRKVEGSTT